MHKELDCKFLLKGQMVRAILQDYSDNGCSMVYEGKAIETDTVLDIEVEGLEVHRHARTVWSKNISDRKASAGLRLL